MNFYIKGKIVQHGERIKDFRGEKYTFKSVSREPEPGKSGKVLVQHGTGARSWQQEYYPSVFDGEIL
jgi:hypothetical protein